jgi:hypothetical protein
MLRDKLEVVKKQIKVITDCVDNYGENCENCKHYGSCNALQKLIDLFRESTNSLKLPEKPLKDYSFEVGV